MADESLPIPPFATGYGLGLLVVPAAVVASMNAGSAVGWTTLVVLTLVAALAGRRFTVQRVLGALAGQLTVVAVGFVLLAPLIFGDW